MMMEGKDKLGAVSRDDEKEQPQCSRSGGGSAIRHTVFRINKLLYLLGVLENVRSGSVFVFVL